MDSGHASSTTQKSRLLPLDVPSLARPLFASIPSPAVPLTTIRIGTSARRKRHLAPASAARSWARSPSGAPHHHDLGARSDEQVAATRLVRGGLALLGPQTQELLARSANVREDVETILDLEHALISAHRERQFLARPLDHDRQLSVVRHGAGGSSDARGRDDDVRFCVPRLQRPTHDSIDAGTAYRPAPQKPSRRARARPRARAPRRAAQTRDASPFCGHLDVNLQPTREIILGEGQKKWIVPRGGCTGTGKGEGEDEGRASERVRNPPVVGGSVQRVEAESLEDENDKKVQRKVSSARNGSCKGW